MTGANHNAPDPNDAVTQGAKAALTNAYNNAAGQTPAVVLTELAGQTLVAGVYTSASGTFGMTGTLTLDGQNDPNSVFIFQTASTLITGGTGNINLIRGAQSCNIFWKIGSAATLGTGSTLRGTVMAHDDISLGSGVTVDGRLFAGEQASGAGAVTLIHDTIIRSVCAAPVPTPTPTPTATPTPTPTATATAGATPKATATAKAQRPKRPPAAKQTPTPSVSGDVSSYRSRRQPPQQDAQQISRVPRGGVHTGDGTHERRRMRLPVWCTDDNANGADGGRAGRRPRCCSCSECYACGGGSSKARSSCRMARFVAGFRPAAAAISSDLVAGDVDPAVSLWLRSRQRLRSSTRPADR